MISYKDKTFCADLCGNLGCHRNRRHLDLPNGRDLPAFEKWAEGFKWAAIARAPFKATCPDYMPTGPNYHETHYMEDWDDEETEPAGGVGDSATAVRADGGADASGNGDEQ